MISIKELKNPDIIEINGVKFQVIENTSLWYHTERKELEMVIELVRVGENRMTPSYRLTYFDEKSDRMKFLRFDINKDVWVVEKLISIKI